MGWLSKVDRHNHATMDAQRQPPVPTTPAWVLHVLPGWGTPDGLGMYRLLVTIDGTKLDYVPYGWSVHPLPLGSHTVKLATRMRIPRANAKFVLSEEVPVVLVDTTLLGGMAINWKVEPYRRL